MHRGRLGCGVAGEGVGDGILAARVQSTAQSRAACVQEWVARRVGGRRVGRARIFQGSSVAGGVDGGDGHGGGVRRGKMGRDSCDRIAAERRGERTAEGADAASSCRGAFVAQGCG